MAKRTRASKGSATWKKRGFDGTETGHLFLAKVDTHATCISSALHSLSLASTCIPTIASTNYTTVYKRECDSIGLYCLVCLDCPKARLPSEENPRSSKPSYSRTMFCPWVNGLVMKSKTSYKIRAREKPNVSLARCFCFGLAAKNNEETASTHLQHERRMPAHTWAGVRI
jgi:hypothetical protein